jgi:hypothetical protein
MAFEEYKDTKPAILIKAALDLIHVPGEVFEVRIPKTRMGTISGYFSDTAVAAALIAKENNKHQALYATVNPIKPALLARNENRFEFGSHNTTSDGDIERRRWFLLDFDPVRPAGISSSDAELEQARLTSDLVIDWLRSLGWPEPMIAESGNGIHVMYRVDEPNDDDTRVIFEFATKMLASLFTDDNVICDTTCFNASRVWKIYGTVAAKGSNTDERPHRVGKIIKVPREWGIVPRGLIENVARPLRDAKSDEFKDMTGEYIADMVKWLSERGLTVTSGPRPMFGNEGQKWTISKCPFNHEHQNPMVGLVSNRPVFRCLHNSCSAFRWKEFREKVDPNYKDPDTIYARLREWCDGDQAEADNELLQSASATGKKLDGILKRLRKDCPRARVVLLEDLLKGERRRFLRETIGENNDKGNIVGLINRTRALQAEGVVPAFWIADFDHKIRVGPIGDIECRKLGVSDEISLLVKFHSMGDSWVKQMQCSQVIQHIAEEYRVNPLRAHMKSFRWDGTKRLDNWLHFYMGTKPGSYTSAVGRKWLISAVARAMDPGCQADHMLIFEGKQGIGKSQALRIIGGQFYTEYSDSMRDRQKLTAVIIGKLIVEMSEMATVKRAEMETLKAILTTVVDDVRLSYERDAKAYPRTCIFGGTTNEVGQSYIADLTGARRFWPVHVGELHRPKIELLKQDRDQLWAEAVEAYEDGEDWYTVPQEEVAAEQMDRQMTIEQTEPWFVKVRMALTEATSYENNLFHCMPEFFNGQETGHFVLRAGQLHLILGILLGIETSRQSANDVQRLQKILRQIGFAKVRPHKGWFGGVYAYDLRKEAVPHLWTAIQHAHDTGKSRKMTEVKQHE